MNFGNPVQNQSLTPYIQGTVSTTTSTPGSYTAVNFPGGSGNYLNFGSSSSANFDYTQNNVFCEMWVYITGSGQQFLVTNMNSTNKSYAFYYNTSGNLELDTQSHSAISGTVPTNTWVHLAFSIVNPQTANRCYIFVNGSVTASSGNATSETYDATRSFYIGYFIGSSQILQGYIRDIRVIQGGTPPTTSFTPDNGPWRYGTIPSYVTGGTNVFGLYGKYLGSPTTNTFGANTLKTYIQGTASVVQSGVGNYRIVSLPGTSGNYFDFGANSPAHFDTRSSTLFMEAWIYCLAANAVNNQIVCAITDATSSDWNCYIGTDNVVHFGYWAPTYTEAKSGTISFGAWNHVAISWNYSTKAMYVFLNGSPSALTTAGTTGVYTTTRTFRIGSETTDSVFNGYIRDLRVIQGATVPTTSFTPDSKLWVAGSIPTYVTGGTNVFGLYGQYLGIQTNYSGLTLLSQLSPSAQNSVMGIFGLRAIIGNVVKAVNIRRSSDNATQDFYADRLGNLLTAPVTGRTLTSWLGGATAYVTTWYDQSPQNNNASQGTSANQPTVSLTGLNSKPMVYWGGINNILLSATNGINTPTFTVVMVLNMAMKTTGIQQWFNSTSFVTGSPSYTSHQNARDIVVQTAPSSGTTISYTYTDNVPFIFILVGQVGGGNGVVTPYINGTAYAADTASGVTNFQLQSMGFGGWSGDGTRTYNGGMSDIYMYSTALNTTDRQYIEGYLAWKVVSSGSILPSNHPYYSVAPSFG